MPQCPVVLHVYDLSQGMARQFSPMIIGKTIDGIWHTGVVAFGVEYYFGGGICYDPPSCTPYGNPMETLQLGSTSKTKQDFLNFLASISNRFSMQNYHVLENNCNNFSDVCCRFLLGDAIGIPKYIIDLPNEAMDSPLGPMLRPILDNMQTVIREQSQGHEIELSENSSLLASRAPQSFSISNPNSSAENSGESPCEQVLFSRANRSAVLSKLKEFDPQFSDSGTSIIAALLASEARLPADRAFPALDLLRLGALENADDCASIVEIVPNLLQKYVLDIAIPRPARMMTLRIAANCFKYSCGAQALCSPKNIEVLVDAVSESMNHDHTAVTKAAVALTFNLTDAPIRFGNKVPRLSEEHSVRVACALVERARSQLVVSAPEESFPLLGALQNLASHDEDARELLRTLDLDLSRYIDESTCAHAKTREIAKTINSFLH